MKFKIFLLSIHFFFGLIGTIFLNVYLVHLPGSGIELLFTYLLSYLFILLGPLISIFYSYYGTLFFIFIIQYLLLALIITIRKKIIKTRKIPTWGMILVALVWNVVGVYNTYIGAVVGW